MGKSSQQDAMSRIFLESSYTEKIMAPLWLSQMKTWPFGLSVNKH